MQDRGQAVQKSQADEAEEQLVLNVNQVQRDLDRMVVAIDSLKTGAAARELHDFVQDELLGLLRLIASDVRSLAVIMSAHDEAIAELAGDSPATQISPEHAAEITEHIRECNSLLKGIYDQSKAAGSPIEPLLARVQKGEALIAFIESVTVVADDEDEGDTDQKN